jgi:hypothetical protein
MIFSAWCAERYSDPNDSFHFNFIEYLHNMLEDVKQIITLEQSQLFDLYPSLSIF